MQPKIGHTVRCVIPFLSAIFFSQFFWLSPRSHTYREFLFVFQRLSPAHDVADPLLSILDSVPSWLNLVLPRNVSTRKASSRYFRCTVSLTNPRLELVVDTFYFYPNHPPPSPGSRDSSSNPLGTIFYYQGFLTEARKNIEPAIEKSRELELQGDTIPALAALGDVLLAQGDMAGAEKNYREAVRRLDLASSQGASFDRLLGRSDRGT